jgi:hypothetical protein
LVDQPRLIVSPQTEIIALSLGERVACGGVFTSHRRSGEGFVPSVDERANSNGEWFALWG